MNSPKVSIIIPIYNTQKYLGDCLNSVIEQTYKNLEIILIDDGSTDDSGKIADQFAKKDPRIKVFHQKNAGQSAARNTGLKKASGDFVSFIDSDDQFNKNFIQKMISPYLKDSSVSLSVCGICYNWLKTKTKQNVFLKPLRNQNKYESRTSYILYLLTIDGRMYSVFNKLFKKDFLDNISFDEKLNFAEDTKFVLDYIKNTPLKSSKISFILEPLCYYNYGTETSTLRKTAVNWKNWQTSYNNLKKWVGKKPSPIESFWLFLILCRWKISYHRAKKRTKA